MYLPKQMYICTILSPTIWKGVIREDGEILYILLETHVNEFMLSVGLPAVCNCQSIQLNTDWGKKIDNYSEFLFLKALGSRRNWFDYTKW